MAISGYMSKLQKEHVVQLTLSTTIEFGVECYKFIDTMAVCRVSDARLHCTQTNISTKSIKK